MSLTGLSTQRLFELGGLKQQCNEALRCVAHGFALPCDACEAEDKPAGNVVCNTCGHLFVQGLLSAEGRACQSAAEFNNTGKIAFEMEAEAELDRREIEADLLEDAAREAAGQARQALEIETRQRDERELAERQRAEQARNEARARERLEASRREAALDAPHPDVLAAIGKRAASRAVWASAVTTAIGASLAWSVPYRDVPRTTGYLVGFAAVAAIAWMLSVLPLLLSRRTAAASRPFAPFVWGLLTFAWPALFAMAAGRFAFDAGFDLGSAKLLLALAIGLAMVVMSVWLGGVGTATRTPAEGSGRSVFGTMRARTGGGTAWICALFHVGWTVPLLVWHVSAGIDAASPVSAPAPLIAAAPTAPKSAATPASVEVLSFAQKTEAAPAPTPIANGHVTDGAGVIAPDDASYLKARLELLAKAGVTARVLVVPGTGNEALEAFAQRVGNTWNDSAPASRSDVLIVVAALDRKIRVETTRDFSARLTDAEAADLINVGFVPAARTAGVAAGLRTLVDRLERLMAAKEYAALAEGDRYTKTLEAVSSVMKAAGAWQGQPAMLAPAAQAMLDSARARLESMPRPARGDRKLARQLHASGIALLGQDGFTALAVEKLQSAHAADPLDVELLNNLAFAEQRAGQHASAIKHLVNTLRLEPGRTSAWVNLADSVPFTAASSAEGRQLATQLFVVGYWFSTDREEAKAFLQAKASADVGHDDVSAAAAAALQDIQRREATTAAGLVAGTARAP